MQQRWIGDRATRCADCMAEQGAGLLVAAKRDRFARDNILAAQLERLVERAGAKLVSTVGASDGDSPEATMMRRILDGFGAFERDLIRGRTRAALSTKRAKRLKFGSTPPYGWRFNGEKMELDIGEHRAVARIWQLAAEGKSFRWIAAALTVEGFPPQGRRWHPNRSAGSCAPTRQHRRPPTGLADDQGTDGEVTGELRTSSAGKVTRSSIRPPIVQPRTDAPSLRKVVALTR